jgi:hypothetical protein
MEKCMVSKWDNLESLSTAETGALTRPYTDEELRIFCDRNFPYITLHNLSHPPDEQTEFTISQETLPCGWVVFCYHQNQQIVMLRTSRYAGRPDTPWATDIEHVAEQADDDSDDDAGSSDSGATDLSWEAMSRLVMAEMLYLAEDFGLNDLMVVEGTPHMIESAYLASQMFEETIKLKTKLDKETQKRLKSRIKYLTQTYSDDAAPSATA